MGTEYPRNFCPSRGHNNNTEGGQTVLGYFVLGDNLVGGGATYPRKFCL